MKEIVMFKKIACLVMAFVFFNATLSYSCGCIEDMRGVITYANPNYDVLVDHINPIVDENFNKDKGIALIIDDDVYLAFPHYEELSILLLNDSAGESKIISADDLQISPNYDYCDYLLFFILRDLLGPFPYLSSTRLLLYLIV